MPNNPAYDLHASLGYQLTVVARLNERPFEDALHELGLTRTTWCVLLAVSVEGLSRPSDIADFVGIDRTATSRALRQMEKQHLIRRAAGRDDGRTTLVAITGAGQEALARATPLARQNAQHFDSRLSADDRAQLVAILNKLKGDAPLSLHRI